MKIPAKGFTLIELMIVVAIIGILAAIALPSFQESLRKSRRSDAIVMISSIQQAQEKIRANSTTYESNLAKLYTYTAADHPYYKSPVISDISAVSYIVTVEPQGSQASDKVGSDACTMVMTVTNGNAVATPKACWSK